MSSYKFSYFLSVVSLFAALVSALIHDLRLLLINFFFAVWNWYLAEYKRGLENENNRESDDTETKE